MYDPYTWRTSQCFPSLKGTDFPFESSKITRRFHNKSLKHVALRLWFSYLIVLNSELLFMTKTQIVNNVVGCDGIAITVSSMDNATGPRRCVFCICPVASFIICVMILYTSYCYVVMLA